MSGWRIRVVHFCASFGFGVVRRAQPIRHALTQALRLRGIEIERYAIVTALSQAPVVAAPGVEVLPLIPERDPAIVLQRDWNVERYVSSFHAYVARLRSVLRSHPGLYEADLVLSDQIPEVFELPVAADVIPIFVNDYFGELECLGEEHAYVDSILASPASILFADTPLLLDCTQQKSIASRFRERFHLGGPILDFSLANRDRDAARAALGIEPDARVVYVAHARTPNGAGVLQALAPLHVVANDEDALSWAASVTGGGAMLTSYDDGLSSADVVLGKGGRITTYEACLCDVPVVCDPFPGNEKEDVFVRTVADAGIAIDARTALPDDAAIRAVRGRLEPFRRANLDSGQLQRAVDGILDEKMCRNP